MPSFLWLICWKSSCSSVLYCHCICVLRFTLLYSPFQHCKICCFFFWVNNRDIFCMFSANALGLFSYSGLALFLFMIGFWFCLCTELWVKSHFRACTLLALELLISLHSSLIFFLFHCKILSFTKRKSWSLSFLKVRISTLLSKVSLFLCFIDPFVSGLLSWFH